MEPVKEFPRDASFPWAMAWMAWAHSPNSPFDVCRDERGWVMSSDLV